MEKFDVFVFGTGTAGKLVANQCVEAGLKTAIVDNREYGGTCSQRGCDPKKLMLASTEAYEFAKNMKGDGIKNVPDLDFNAMHRYAKRYFNNIPSKTEKNLKDAGIKCLHGEASFVNSNTVQLNGEKITADKFVIATGLQPMKLGIPGEEHSHTSDGFFKIEHAPKSVVFIGGGYIGMEFSHMLNRCGSKVTVIEQSNQILGPFEEYTASFLEKTSIAQGIDIFKNAQVTSIEKVEGRFVVKYFLNGSTHQITTDYIFNTAGRVPSVDTLDLEKAAVVTDDHGITVNKKLQSVSQPHIYACGDVSSRNLPLTPLSGREAKVVAHNITKGDQEIDFPAIPSVAFTIPHCGGIGLTEKQARETEKEIEVIERDASGWFNNQRINAAVYAYKIIVEKESRLILGVHIIGMEASEQLNMFAIAMKAGMPLDELQDVIFTYPSWGNDIISF